MVADVGYQISMSAAGDRGRYGLPGVKPGL